MYEITLDYSIDAAHRVVGHKGKCAQLHGHTYHFGITVAADLLLAEPEFVIDFADLKEPLKAWDHKTLLWDRDPLVVLLGEEAQEATWMGVPVVAVSNSEHDGVVRLPFNPTSENMARHLAEVYARWIMASNRRGWVEVEVSETPKSRARWREATPDLEVQTTTFGSTRDQALAVAAGMAAMRREGRCIP